MTISIRNCIACQVADIKTGAVNDQITLTSEQGDQFVAIITSDSTKNLGLTVGKAAYALIKSSFVSIAIDDALKTSARNQIAATVDGVVPGAVNAEVTATTAHGTQIVSVITKASAERLGLKFGAKVQLIIKASNILVGVK